MGALTLLAVLGGNSVLAGCASGAPKLESDQSKLPKVSIEGLEDVTAELDYVTATVTTPISEYVTGDDFETEKLFTQARQALLTRCMTSAGYAYTGYTDVDWDSVRPQADRKYGLWDRSGAALFGMGFDPSRGIPEGGAPDQDADFTGALNACNEALSQDDTFGPLEQKRQELPIADRIQGNAANLALQSEPAQQAMQSFITCMEDKSIVVDRKSGDVSSEYAQLGQEEQIGAAVAEAECNVDTGRIETIYNLQARYETAYLKKYEAQLGEVLQEKEKLHGALAGIIEDAG